MGAELVGVFQDPCTHFLRVYSERFSPKTKMRTSASRGKSAIALQHQVIGLLPLQGFIMNYKPI